MLSLYKQRRFEMNTNNGFVVLIVSILTIWFMSFALAIMMRQHEVYVRHSGRAIKWSLRLIWTHFIVKPVRWAWARWAKEIVCFLAGIVVGITLATKFFR